MKCKKPDTKEYVLYKAQKQATLIYGDGRQYSHYLWEGGINDAQGGVL